LAESGVCLPVHPLSDWHGAATRLSAAPLRIMRRGHAGNGMGRVLFAQMRWPFRRQAWLCQHGHPNRLSRESGNP